MKLILAIIQPPKLDAIRTALQRIGVESITVCDARGYARQRGQVATYRGHQYKANLLRKVTVEIAVHEDQLERVVELLQTIGRTAPDGCIGDGKIFILPVNETVRIEDGVRGIEAI